MKRTYICKIIDMHDCWWPGDVRSPGHQQSCISINMILSWSIRTVAGSARGSLNHKTDIFKHMFGCRENPFLFALRIFPRLTILRTSLVRCGHDIWLFVVVRRDIVVGIFFCTYCHDAGYTPYIKLCHIQCKCYTETEITEIRNNDDISDFLCASTFQVAGCKFSRGTVLKLPLWGKGRADGTRCFINLLDKASLTP